MPTGHGAGSLATRLGGPRKPAIGRPKGVKNKPNPWMRMLKKEATEDRWRLVVLTAFQQAGQGDAKAREWLGRYLIGTPTNLHVISQLETLEQLLGLAPMDAKGIVVESSESTDDDEDDERPALESR